MTWRVLVSTDGRQRLILRIGAEPSSMWAGFQANAEWTHVADVEAAAVSK